MSKRIVEIKIVLGLSPPPQTAIIWTGINKTVVGTTRAHIVVDRRWPAYTAVPRLPVCITKETTAPHSETSHPNSNVSFTPAPYRKVHVYLVKIWIYLHNIDTNIMKNVFSILIVHWFNRFAMWLGQDLLEFESFNNRVWTNVSKCDFQM